MWEKWQTLEGSNKICRMERRRMRTDFTGLFQGFIILCTSVPLPSNCGKNTISPMNDLHDPLPWEQPDWFPQVIRWIDEHLTAHGLKQSAPVELVHQRPWSAFARVPTSGGMVYFKAPAPVYRYEVALTEALAQWRPEDTVPLLAVERERGWMLSLDAGRTLREAAPSAEQVEHWVRLLPQYVELQMEMTARVPALLALGVPDRRLVTLPALYEQLLQADESLRVGLEPGLTHEEFQRLLALRSQVAEWCELLAGMGPPETLTHEEVHDANVLVGGGRYVFIDWSDASVAHPFFTMLVTLRAAAYRLKLPEDGPEMTRVRDAYLEPWTAFATRETLLSSFNLARRLAMLNRALSWHHGLAPLPPQQREADADAVPEWLRDFLNEEDA